MFVIEQNARRCFAMMAIVDDGSEPMPDTRSRKPSAAARTTAGVRTDAGEMPADGGPSAVVAGRRGGIKSATNRPVPADAAARRKEALHALRHAFEADIGLDDEPAPTVSR